MFWVINLVALKPAELIISTNLEVKFVTIQQRNLISLIAGVYIGPGSPLQQYLDFAIGGDYGCK